MSPRPEKRVYVTDAAHTPSLLELKPLLLRCSSDSRNTWAASLPGLRTPLRWGGRNPESGAGAARAAVPAPGPSMSEPGARIRPRSCGNVQTAENTASSGTGKDASGTTRRTAGTCSRRKEPTRRACSAMRRVTRRGPSRHWRGPCRSSRTMRQPSFRWDPSSTSAGEGRKEGGFFFPWGGVADEAADLPDIIDEAGMFLIQEKEYEDGIALYRAAVERFPDSPALYAGCACCAGHMGRFDEALEAAERAVDLDPASIGRTAWTGLTHVSIRKIM